MTRALRIGFIPLVDAAPLLIAVDKGFSAREGIAIELVREVSWSNVRDKLNLGMFDAAHLLAPVAIASSLGAGHFQMPIIAPLALSTNGNAITVSPALYREISDTLLGEWHDPLATALALARVARTRRKTGAAPITFGMTFPYSTHNYQLRFWMAAGGIDPDDDVRLVVLPPPFMADSLASGQVDGFCVGAPWNAVAVARGAGRILHPGPDILRHAVEKVLAVRARWAEDNSDLLAALIRASHAAATFIEQPENHAEVSAILARPDRVGADAASIEAVLSGLVMAANGETGRDIGNYVAFARGGADRPDPAQAEWLYAQMVRWRKTAHSAGGQAAARAVFRPDLYDGALGLQPEAAARTGVGPFVGPELSGNVDEYLAAMSQLAKRSD